MKIMNLVLIGAGILGILSASNSNIFGAAAEKNQEKEDNDYEGIFEHDNINALEKFRNQFGSPVHETLFHGAARWGSAKIAKYLIDRDADINALNNLNRTPLLEAIVIGLENKNVERKVFRLIKYLLNEGADPDIYDKKNFNALSYAILQTDVALVELLLKNNAVITENIKKLLEYRKNLAMDNETLDIGLSFERIEELIEKYRKESQASYEKYIKNFLPETQKSLSMMPHELKELVGKYFQVPVMSFEEFQDMNRIAALEKNKAQKALERAKLIEKTKIDSEKKLRSCIIS